VVSIVENQITSVHSSKSRVLQWVSDVWLYRLKNLSMDTSKSHECFDGFLTSGYID